MVWIIFSSLGALLIINRVYVCVCPTSLMKSYTQFIILLQTILSNIILLFFFSKSLYIPEREFIMGNRESVDREGFSVIFAKSERKGEKGGIAREREARGSRWKSRVLQRAIAVCVCIVYMLREEANFPDGIGKLVCVGLGWHDDDDDEKSLGAFQSNR